MLVIKHMNVGDATAILFSAPIWAGCMARIILKEKYTIVSLIATVSGLVGIVLILKPTVLFPNFLDRGESSIPWAFVTLGMSFLAAASYVSIAIVEMVSGFSTNQVMNESLVLPPCNWVRGVLFFCGLSSTLANCLIVRGLSLENCGPATLMRNWDMVYTYVLQITVFRFSPDWICILGAGLIVCTSVLQGLDKLVDLSCGIEF